MIRVQDGYSIQGDAAVGFSTSVLDILSLQQRLAYLGFTDVDGSRLTPTGTYQEGTRHAVDVFNSAVRAPTFTSSAPEIDKTFINLAKHLAGSIWRPSLPPTVSPRIRESILLSFPRKAGQRTGLLKSSVPQVPSCRSTEC